MSVIKLNREAAGALMAEAQREFENAAQERWGGTFHDESQTANLEASTELVGCLGSELRSWPKEESAVGPYERPLVEFDLRPQTLDWLVGRQMANQEAFVRDLDGGTNQTDPGYIAEQVYLLHVLRGIAAQREEAGV